MNEKENKDQKSQEKMVLQPKPEENKPVEEGEILEVKSRPPLSRAKLLTLSKTPIPSRPTKESREHSKKRRGEEL